MQENNDSELGVASSAQQFREPHAAYATETQTSVSDKQAQEVIDYWNTLSSEKKRIVLDLMRVFSESEPPVRIPDDEWAEMMKQRADFIAGTAKTYTREEAREILRNPEQRDALLNNRK